MTSKKEGLSKKAKTEIIIRSSKRPGISDVIKILEKTILSSSSLISKCGVPIKKIIDDIHKNLDITTDFERKYQSAKVEELTSYYLLYDKQLILILIYWSWWALVAYNDRSLLEEILEGYDFYSPSVNTVTNALTYLTIDHVSQSIVLFIRGTVSTDDIIADALGTLSPIYANFDSSEKIHVHSGFNISANQIHNQFIDKILEYLVKTGYRYPLKICGHSYGAGIASVLCLVLEKLRLKGTYFDKAQFGLGIYPIRSFNFCCPPVYNEFGSSVVCEMANQITIVNGWDVVPRASLSNFQEMICGNNFPVAKESHVYVPQAIYWLIYSEDTGQLVKISLINSFHPTLTKFWIHPNMITDHSMSSVYATLLAAEFIDLPHGILI